MKSRLLVLLIAISIATTARGQELFSDDFNTDSSANYTTTATSADTDVQFGFDYSVLGIPVAPSTTDATTLGLRLAANLTEPGAPEAVTLSTVIQFSGNYSVSFDAWINASSRFPGGGAGSTEYITGGLGGDGVTANLGGASGSGAWIAVSGDGGSTRDYRMYKNDSEQFAESGQFAAGSSSAGGGAHNNNDPYYASFGNVNVGGLPVQGEIPQQSGSTAAGSFGFAWHRVELVVDPTGGSGGTAAVTWLIDGLRIGTLDAGQGATFQTDGSASVGIMDIFSSVSDSAQLSFGLIDNLLVEVAQTATIRVAQQVEFDVINESGGRSSGTFLVENRSDVDLLVNEVNISGTDSDAFTLDTGLPLVVTANSSATVDLTFTAIGDTGAKSASVEFVSTDSISPSVSLPLEAIFAATLLAHYKLDEAGGTVVIEDSENGPDGVFTITDPLVYSAEALASGTSIGFTAAQFPPAGNFAFMRPLHVPTTSISLWIRPDSGDGGTDTLFNRDPEFSGGDIIYGCFVDDGGKLTYRSGGEITLESPAGAVVDGETYHVVITHLDEDGFGNDTATRSRMYIDGVMVAENTSPTGFNEYPASASTGSFYLATRSAAGFGFDGLIDDLQIYSIEITPAQVANMFAAPGITALDEVPEFRFTEITYNMETREVSLTWNSLPNGDYIVEDTGDFLTWGEIDDTVPSQGFSTTYRFTALPSSRHFYRVSPRQ